MHRIRKGAAFMSTVIVVGTQWGDEGKGKIVDLLTEFADSVVRHQGGNNAGHTLVVDGKTVVLHIVPSGALHKSTTCLVAPGVVIDPEVLWEEIEMLQKQGHLEKPGSLRLSGNCHIIMPYHKVLDALCEDSLGEQKIGTTGRGIGPVYEDKAARRGIRLMDLMKPEELKAKVKRNLKRVNALVEHLYGQKPVSDDFLGRYITLGQKLQPYMDDVVLRIHEKIEGGRHLLFEGAQGALLDPDHGTYPFNTSSPTVSGGALTGAGVGPKDISEVVGITKAYTTRVGSGPFPTELHDETGDLLRQRGHEFGATTGRSRRCGWLDAVALRHSVRVNGLTAIALTKLDVLTGLETVRIAVGYRLNGEYLDFFPMDPQAQMEVEPVYEDMAGWTEDITQARDLDDLPANARRYMNRISDLAGVPIVIASVGPARSETIVLNNPFRMRRD